MGPTRTIEALACVLFLAHVACGRIGYDLSEDPLSADAGGTIPADASFERNPSAADASATDVLTDGTPDPNPPPQDASSIDGGADGGVVGAAGASQVASGDLHTCAIFNKALRCWGRNALYQLGDGTTIDHRTATLVPNLPEPLEIVAGPGLDIGTSQQDTRSSHTCGRFADGTVRCWGPDVNGENAMGTTASLYRAPTIIAGLNGAAQLAIGQFHTCARFADGTVQCWGTGDRGELGDGTTTAWRATPKPVVGLNRAVEIAANDGTSCARLDDGTVQCWGRDGAGRFGASRPTAIAGLDSVTQISSNGPMCALKANGSVACWDGVGATPRALPGLAGAVRIGAGWLHACAVMSDTTVQCWGDNSFGQLGTGTISSRVAPAMPVMGLTGVVDVVASFFTTCALRSDGSVWCWGDNASGQCGDGTTTRRTVPVLVRLAP